jgi:hypothetical protein
MTPSDIYYADILALTEKHPANVTEFDIKLLQDHARKTCTPDGIVMKVVESYVTRSIQGIEKYGVTMGANPESGTFWLRNLIEELQDATVYGTRLLEPVIE